MYISYIDVVNLVSLFSCILMIIKYQASTFLSCGSRPTRRFPALTNKMYLLPNCQDSHQKKGETIHESITVQVFAILKWFFQLWKSVNPLGKYSSPLWKGGLTLQENRRLGEGNGFGLGVSRSLVLGTLGRFGGVSNVNFWCFFWANPSMVHNRVFMQNPKKENRISKIRYTGSASLVLLISSKHPEKPWSDSQPAQAPIPSFSASNWAGNRFDLIFCDFCVAVSKISCVSGHSLIIQTTLIFAIIRLLHNREHILKHTPI